jgi:hypothetical protein
VGQTSDFISTGISTLPALIVAIVIAVAVVANWSELRALIRRTSRVSVVGIQMDIAARALEQAEETKSGQPAVRGTANSRTEKMAHLADAMARTRILWVMITR